jgi:hypothetical protein
VASARQRLESICQYSPFVESHDPDGHDYLAREARARVQIDKQLAAAGWVVQGQQALNFGAGLGVAVREFTLEKPHGRVDYLLFLNGQPAGVIEAKPEGTPLVEVERQSGKYVDGLPEWVKPAVYPLPFIYESTGAETRFTNGYDPEARSATCSPSSRDADRWVRRSPTGLPTFTGLEPCLRWMGRAAAGQAGGAIRNRSSLWRTPRSLIRWRPAREDVQRDRLLRLCRHADARRILFWWTGRT